MPDDILVIAQKNLFALKELLDTNPYLFHSAPGDHTGARSAAASEQEAWKVTFKFSRLPNQTLSHESLGGTKLGFSAPQSAQSHN